MFHFSYVSDHPSLDPPSVAVVERWLPQGRQMEVNLTLASSMSPSSMYQPCIRETLIQKASHLYWHFARGAFVCQSGVRKLFEHRPNRRSAF